VPAVKVRFHVDETFSYPNHVKPDSFVCVNKGKA